MFHESHWRRIADPIIRRVLAENVDKPMKEIRSALRAAYPFGPRRYHPYKIWCDEVRRQMGLKHKSADPRQEEMFPEGA